MVERFDNQTAWVSGGAREGGISRRVVEDLAYRGASVAFVDDDPHGEGVAKRINAEGGKAFFFEGDLREPEAAERFAKSAAERFGLPRVVVNVVGGSKGSGGPHLHQPTLAQLMGTYLQNVGTALNIVRSALPYLLEKSGDRSVLLIETVNGAPGDMAYSCAKASLGAYVRWCASAYGRYGIRFNLLICPAYEVKSDRFKDQRIAGCGQSLYTMARWREVQRVSNPVLFLAYHATTWVTGETFCVDGGLTAFGGIQTREDGP